MVRERGTGKPVSGARVTWQFQFPHGEEFRSSCIDGVTDAHGRVALDGMPCKARRCTLAAFPFVEAPAGFCWGPVRMKIPAGVKVFELPPIEMVLTCGRVVDQKGRPVAYARVEYSANETMRDARGSDGIGTILVSDKAGKFQIWLDPARTCELKGFAGGYLPSRLAIDFVKLPKAEFPDLVLQAKRTAPVEVRRLTGRVVDRQGKPVSGALVFPIARRVRPESDGSGMFAQVKLAVKRRSPTKGDTFAWRES